MFFLLAFVALRLGRLGCKKFRCLKSLVVFAVTLSST